MKFDTDNERAKHAYLRHLRGAKGYEDATLDAFIKSIDRFEQYTGHRSFSRFRLEQALGFKAHLIETRNQTTGEPLSKSTICATLNYLEKFFHWLADEPAYRNCFRHGDAEYFTPSRRDARLGAERRAPSVPTLDQLRQVLQAMPFESDNERRDRALIAFIVTTGARGTAVTTAKLKHLNSSELQFNQDAREVRTKFSKTQCTTFFAVGPDIHAIVSDYETWLRNDKNWTDDDPLFPASIARVGNNACSHEGFSREHWRSSAAVRAIFRKGFARAGLPYFRPHNVRHMLARLGLDLKLSPRDFKAWSQNLGHDNLQTTLLSYGEIDDPTQVQIMRDLTKNTCGEGMMDTNALDKILERIRSEFTSRQ